MGVKFQSSPDPKAGCYLLIYEPGLSTQVSILTRPEGRVLLRVHAPNHPIIGFNPHPTRRPGATENIRKLPLEIDVSILTRPEGRVLHLLCIVRAFCRGVSILTRPEGRVLQRDAERAAKDEAVSILTRPEGRVLLHGISKYYYT